ncbi:MAG: 16S rRNA (cytidine(1402)-2'-O)-methyltransferase [Flavobacteriia bacterium]|jgi:16S rRNA (cytidine1402-2'-O)-methyltransferase|nr:16S rRNA (cytidine(1402)-2'-O)-methyltransferase [Flavobacteriia bacterium]NBY39454.1 16S rRNA (cytidine(1402)-2'-O)-methyltransferase [Flavobacteriia bacterium]
MAHLIAVPTPIGNLEDITLRSIRMLKACDFVIAEDTRVTKKLLKLLDIQKWVVSFHTHNEHAQLAEMLHKIETAEMVVLVSDAGTPGISDPGYLLIRGCIEKGIKVECLPGPTAFVPALVASGLPCDRFYFEGFLPHKKGRQTKMKALVDKDCTVVLYESPYRLIKCLEQIIEFMGPERKVVVGREISKMFEEFVRGTAPEVLLHFKSKEIKGEFVVMIASAEG